MSWYSKVAWSEGLFLRQHHLQQNDRYLERTVENRVPLVRAATGGRVSRRTDVDRFIESLVGPLYLRVFVTGAPVDDRYVDDTVRRALASI